MNGENIFKVGDLVMFKNRANFTSDGMKVEEVNSNVFDTLLKVDSKWWRPGSFIALEDWKSNVFHRELEQ